MSITFVLWKIVWLTFCWKSLLRISLQCKCKPLPSPFPPPLQPCSSLSLSLAWVSESVRMCNFSQTNATCPAIHCGTAAPTLCKGMGFGVFFFIWAILAKIYDSVILTQIRLKIPGTHTKLSRWKFGLTVSGCSFGTLCYQRRKAKKSTWDFSWVHWAVRCLISCVYISFSVSLYKSDWFTLKVSWNCSLWQFFNFQLFNLVNANWYIKWFTCMKGSYVTKDPD